MKKIVLIGLTHPPSSCRWRSPLHRVVCYLESPRDKRWTQEWKRRHLRMSDLWRSHFSLLLEPTSQSVIPSSLNSHPPSSSFLLPTYAAEFVLALGAGVHEGLGDDGEWGVHYFRHVDIKGEVGILEDVHPEAQRKTVRETSPSLS